MARGIWACSVGPLTCVCDDDRPRGDADTEERPVHFYRLPDIGPYTDPFFDESIKDRVFTTIEARARSYPKETPAPAEGLKEDDVVPVFNDTAVNAVEEASAPPAGNNVSRAANAVSREVTGTLRKGKTEVVGESLEWLNEVVECVWPKVDKAVEHLVRETLLPDIVEALPKVLRGIKLSKFTLGLNHPKFSNVRVFEVKMPSHAALHHERHQRAIEIELTIVLESDLDVELEIPHFAKLGISKLSINGDLAVRLEPLLDKEPIVGGVVFFFYDHPRIDLKFTGLGKFAQHPQIASLIRSKIDDVITEYMVLPNVQCVAIAASDDELVHLRRPTPLGVLRVTALSGRNLKAADWHLFSAATSDPYIKIVLADQQWQSSVVKRTLDPVWSVTDFSNFFVYDQDQQIKVNVFDEDVFPLNTRVKKDDHIGRVEPLSVIEAMEWSETEIPLIDPGSSEDAGHLTLRFEWSELVPIKENEDTHCVVEVEIHEACIPAVLGRSAGLRAIMCGQKLETRVYVQSEDEKKSEKLLQKAKEGVAKRCLKCGKEVEDAMELTEFDEEAVKRLQKGESIVDTASMESSDRKLKLDYVLRFIVPIQGLGEEALRLEMINDKKKILGTSTIDVNAEEESDKTECVFENPHNHKIEAAITINLLGLKRGKLTEKANHMTGEAHLERVNSVLTSFGRSARFLNTDHSLDWLNEALRLMWDNIDRMVSTMMQNEVSQQVRQQLPLVDFKVTKCWLGDTPPTLGPVKVTPLKDKHVEILLGVTFNSNIELLISTMFAKLGLHSLSFNGQLCIRFTPLIDEMPILGGMVICFMDAPIIEFHLSGAAKLAEHSFLMRTILNQIEVALCQKIVLPNVIGLPFGTEEQGIDRAHLNCLVPLGGLRVTVVKGEDLLAGDINILSANSSDPFVKVVFGDTTWQSPTVKASLNPVWPTKDASHYFLVYDMDQSLRIDVYDEDLLSAPDHIGYMDKITIKDALEKYSREKIASEDAKMPLFNPSCRSEPAGFLQMTFEWVEILKPGQLGRTQSIVEVKFDEVDLPAELGQMVSIRATFDKQHKATPFKNKEAHQSAGEVAAYIDGVIRKCYEKDFSMDVMTKISEKSREDVLSILPLHRQDSRKKVRESVAAALKDKTHRIDLEHVLRFIVPTRQIEMDGASIRLELFGEGQVPLGTAVVKLADVLSSGCSEDVGRIGSRESSRIDSKEDSKELRGSASKELRGSGSKELRGSASKELRGTVSKEKKGEAMKFLNHDKNKKNEKNPTAEVTVSIYGFAQVEGDTPANEVQPLNRVWPIFECWRTCAQGLCKSVKM